MNISIVTICFNNLEELIATCQMVDSQNLPPLEHIIVNGSTTKDIDDYLNNAPQPGYRKWISEPDKGISDAFNKGIQKATGDIIHLQNAGDKYYDEEVLKTVSNTFESNPQIQWLHGCYAQYRGGIWLLSGKRFERKKLYRGMRTIGHPTMFVHRNLYQKYGLFDLDKKIAMDYDFLVRIADEPFAFIDKPLVYFVPGGVSEKKIKEGLKEVRESYFKYKGFDLRVILWSWRILWLNKFTSSRLGKTFFKLKNFKGKMDPN
jgi:GT2 family glycosyltransferase